MNEVFMINGGKKTQEISGSISTTAPVGGATEAKQDAIITAINNITIDPPVGGATEAKQDTIIGHIDGLEGQIGIVTETAPGTDTASSGLNGRLQRIAQRLTSLIGLLPTSLGQGTMATSMKVVLPSDQSAIPVTLTSTTITGTVAATQSGTWTLGANSGVDIGDVTLNNASIAVTDNAGSLTVDAPVATPVFVRLSDGASAISTLPVSLASVPSHAVTNAGTFAVQSTNQANSGVDIGDVTINNASGASAVNIQDGGNTITVDNGGTFAVQAAQSGTWTVQPGNTANTTPWLIKEVRASTPSQTSPSVTNSSTSVLASNANRLGATIYNEGSAICYLKLGSTASITSYSCQVASGGYYEVPFDYTGAIDGITSSGTAQLRVTEIT